MDATTFERLVRQQWQVVPEEFRSKIDNLSLQIEDLADAEALKEVGLGHPEDLLGLYQGWPLPDRGLHYGSCLPDVIFLYQRAIEAHAAREGLPISRVIRETIIHELGHYFGFSEEEMAFFEDLWAGLAEK